MLSRTQDNEEIIERVAALDIGKAELVCCVRVPDEDPSGEAAAGGGDLFYDDRSLLGMSDHLACLGRDAGGDGPAQFGGQFFLPGTAR